MFTMHFVYLLTCVCLLTGFIHCQKSGKFGQPNFNFKPRFKKSSNPLTEEVRENSEAGYLVADISNHAIDDEGDPLEYDIDNVGREVCTIDKFDGKLRLKIKPDREHKSYYNFKIFVKDDFEGGVNREASLDVHLYIQDMNDNRPVFQSQSYHADVPENANIGTVVLTVTAIDADVGNNRKIRYTFKENTEHNGFILNSDTGVITTSKQLNYELESKHILQIIAKDQGWPALSEETEVIVNVVDVGDIKPQFVLHESEKDIMENLPKGTQIAVVNAQDGDKSINNQINYDITAGDEYGLFMIDKRTGNVTVQGDLDRESYREFNLRITAYEVQEPSSNADIQFRIKLLDANDNKPIFRKKNYFYTVEDGKVNPGTIIGDDIHADDADATPINSALIYGIYTYADEDSEYFDVRSKTGMLVLKKDLKNRNQDIYSFLVYATERDTREHHTAKANVTVKIVSSPNKVVNNYRSYSKSHASTISFQTLLTLFVIAITYHFIKQS